jgi:hypothetical protein
MRIIVVFQAVYYLVTGLWPVFDMDTFQAVTGPKTDDWLVNTVGLLAAAIGATLLFGAMRQKLPRETILLAVLSAASFIAIDVVYTTSGTISKIYLADAAVETFFVLGIAATAIYKRTREK